MKRLMLTLMALTLPVVAAAQQDSARSPEGVIVPHVDPSLAASGAVQGNPGPGPGTRRRPSMVGYIEDSSVFTKVRIRYDIGTGLEAPDRAEFFYAKCGCYRFLPNTNDAYDPDAPGPGPGVLIDANYSEFNIYGEYALNDRIGFAASLPIRTLRPQEFVAGTGAFGDTNGFSDIKAGVKIGLASDTYSQLTLQVMTSLPTGDSKKGLGTNHMTIEPAVTYGTQIGEHAAIESQFGTVFPLDGSAGVPVSSPDKFSGKVIYYGIGPSVDIYNNGFTRVTPVVELFGWHVIDGFSTFEGGQVEGLNIVNLKIGGRVSAGRGSIYVGWGTALTDVQWYDNILRFEYRYGF